MARGPGSGPAPSTPSPASGPRPSGPPSGVRKRKVVSSSSGQPRAQIPGGGTSGSGTGLLRFYSEDSTGLKIGPTVVLVISLLFIAFVILLHFWGKFHRSS